MKRIIASGSAPAVAGSGPLTRSRDENAPARVTYHGLAGRGPKRRRTSKRPSDGAASPGPDDARSETSGPVGAGRARLPLRRPLVETEPRLAYDRTPPPDGSFEFFRWTGDLSRLDESYDLTGLAELNLSGSESFSTLAQARRLKERASGGRLHVLSVRLESTAIVDDHLVTLRGRRDWANAGLSHDEALAREAGLVEDLQASTRLVLARSVDLRKGVAEPHTVTLDRPVVTTEQDLVGAIDGVLHRLTVTNHLRPERPEVDRLVDLVRVIPPGEPVHVHCGGGHGRTTTTMVQYDMLRNAHRVSAADIIRRQERLSHDFNMTVLNPAKPYKMAFAADRHAFILEFHRYARANPGGRPMRWSEWRKTDAPAEAGPSGQASVGGI